MGAVTVAPSMASRRVKAAIARRNGASSVVPVVIACQLAGGSLGETRMRTEAETIGSDCQRSAA